MGNGRWPDMFVVGWGGEVEGGTAVETAELDTHQQINHLFILLKARARQTLSASN